MSRCLFFQRDGETCPAFVSACSCSSETPGPPGPQGPPVSPVVSPWGDRGTLANVLLPLVDVEPRPSRPSPSPPSCRRAGMYFMSLRPKAWPSAFLPPGWASRASPPLVCNPVFLNVRVGQGVQAQLLPSPRLPPPPRALPWCRIQCQAWDRSRCSWDPELCCGCRV